MRTMVTWQERAGDTVLVVAKGRPAAGDRGLVINYYAMQEVSVLL